MRKWFRPAQVVPGFRFGVPRFRVVPNRSTGFRGSGLPAWVPGFWGVTGSPGTQMAPRNSGTPEPRNPVEHRNRGTPEPRTGTPEPQDAILREPRSHPMSGSFTRSLLAATSLFAILSVPARPSADAEVQTTPPLLADLLWRNIGPANMAGRVTDIEAVEANPAIVYVGRGVGRRLEIDERRHDVEADLHELRHVEHRRHRDLPEGSEHRLGRHRRRAACATASRGATASTSPPTAARRSSTWG